MAGEQLGEVTHAFGRIDAWPMFRALGRRPFVFTAVAPAPLLDRKMYERASAFVAESEPLATALQDAGIPRQTIRIIYPGVDLLRFVPEPLPPAQPFRIVFASSPADPDEIEPRGIGLLIELAKRHRDIEVVVPWRRWGSLRRADRALMRLSPPPNFRIEHRGSRHMADVYASAHATACLFDEGVGKSCPNSVIEGLACGRPVLISRTCGIADLVGRHGAGVVSERRPDDLSAALQQLRENLVDLSRQARVLAEKEFGLDTFCRKYIDVYTELARQPAAFSHS